MPVSLRIPPGTPNGRTFRVRGKGVRRQDSTYGDLLVTVDVRVPRDINGEAREALETLRKLAPGEDQRDDLLRRANPDLRPGLTPADVANLIVALLDSPLAPASGANIPLFSNVPPE